MSELLRVDLSFSTVPEMSLQKLDSLTSLDVSLATLPDDVDLTSLPSDVVVSQ